MIRLPHLTLLPRLLMCLLVLGPPTTPAWALNTDLPELGNSAGSLMTPKRERELGKAFMRSIRRSQKVMDDPVMDDYVQWLGSTLVKSSGAAGTPFKFFLVEDPQINAFAGPGGYIGVYTGLLLTTETESELAAVLAHEIAHVTQQHLLRAWEATSNMSVPNAAILLAAIVLGATIGGDAGIAAAVGGQAAILQRQINFTRSNEKEADRVGIDILANAGYEPRAMPTFFSRMGKANRIYASKLPEFLLTHPVSTSRTADALGRAEDYPYHQSPEGLRYHLARTNLVQRRIDQPEDAIRELQLMLEDGRYRNRAAVEYGIALAQLRARQYEAAGHTLRRLNEAHPEVIEFIVARAEADDALGRRASALQQLDKALARHPGSHALNLSYAEFALKQGKAEAASKRLQRYRQYYSDEPRIYKLLSEAAGKMGHQGAGHEYLAEYYYLIGELKQAIQQIEIALKRPELDFYQSSRLESRLTALRDEQDEEERKRSAKP